MDSAAIVTGIFTIVGVIIGFGLEHVSKYLSGKKKIKRQFLELRGDILSTPMTNWLYPNLYPPLRKLRRFFVKHPEYLKRQENDLFFRKWLTDPFLDSGIETAHWEAQKIEEMFRDLSATKV